MIINGDKSSSSISIPNNMVIRAVIIIDIEVLNIFLLNLDINKIYIANPIIVVIAKINHENSTLQKNSSIITATVNVIKESKTIKFTMCLTHFLNCLNLTNK